MPPEQEVGGSNPLGRANFSPRILQDTISQLTPSSELANLKSLVQEEQTQGLGQFVFVTGRAGTGKSTLLREFVASLQVPKAVLAPTGLAAINVGGQTIHSFFNFPLGPLEQDPDRIPVFKRGGNKSRLFNKLQVLIIDEISMIRADLLDAIDASLRWNRQTDEPFGGLKVVVFGDLWQLEPVVGSSAEAEFLSHHFASPFFFDSHILRELQPDILQLDHVYRQSDPEYLWALDQIRIGNTQELSFFNDRLNAPLPPDGMPLTLTATNNRALTINIQHLGEIVAEPRTYQGKVEGDFGKDLPADLHLTLKPGAQVMFVKNGRTWVNGTLGQIQKLEQHEITVHTHEGKTVTVERETWEKQRYVWDRATQRIQIETVGSYTQFPLKLAWAVTVHKSQGLTLEQAIIDLDRPAFSHGQTYVALSRNRHLDGLSLRREITKSDVITHPRVVEFGSICALD